MNRTLDSSRVGFAAWRAGCIALVAFACVSLGGRLYGQIENRLPQERDAAGIDQKPGEQIPLDLTLVRSDGVEFTTGDIFNGQKPKILTLNYSDCPMLCSVQLNALTASLNDLDLQLGRDFEVITVSIDWRETSEKAAKTKLRYVRQLDNQPTAAEGWNFYTADQETIKRLTDSVGFRYAFDPISKEYNHAAMLAFLSPEGVISLYSLRIDFPVSDLKLAIVDAGEGTVGSAVDQFVLWCYSYDPERNKYTPVAWKLMRLGGLLTIVTLGLTLVPFWLGLFGKPKTADEALQGDDGDAKAGSSSDFDSAQ